MSHPALRTVLTERTGVAYPIVQTGMGYVAGPRLVAGVANAGGLGIIASATLSFSELADAVARTQDQTDRPFGVNLRSDAPDVFERGALMVREGVRVASFALAPNERLIKQLKDEGLFCIPSVGAARHAEKVAGWGADAVIVTGHEAAGHVGAVATSVLVPQVVDAVDIPVIAAGGFFDGRGLVAALAYGAAGIAMGTRFLMTQDSSVPDVIKDIYLTKRVTDTVVTTQVDGLPDRLLRTPFVDELERTTALTSIPRAIKNAFRMKRVLGTPWKDLIREALSMKRTRDLTWSQVVMAPNAFGLFKASMVDGNVDSGCMAAGQVVGLMSSIPSAKEVVDAIVREAESTLARLESSR